MKKCRNAHDRSTGIKLRQDQLKQMDYGTRISD